MAFFEEESNFGNFMQTQVVEPQFDMFSDNQGFQQQPQQSYQQPYQPQQSMPPPRQNGAGAYDANDYQRMEQREHVLKRPDTYLGSLERSSRDARLLDLNNVLNSENQGPYFNFAQITLPQAMEQTFKEVITNCADNVINSRNSGVDPGTINITMDRNMISVRNGGKVIPVQINIEENMYAAELIFGNLLTSSNYNDDEERTVAGKNGYGAKITNIMSSQFVVKIGDPVNGLEYYQQWTSNMSVRGEPIINQYSGEGYVEVSYILDMHRFGGLYGEAYQCYPDEAFHFFAALAADISFTCNVPVIFNGIEINIPTIEEYVRWTFGPQTRKMLLHDQYPMEKDEEGKWVRIKGKGGKKLVARICVIDTPDNSKVISFVNGLFMPDGGKHVEAVTDNVRDYILPMINKEVSEIKDVNVKLTMRDVKPHISLIILCTVDKPIFQGQFKSKLTNPKPQIIIGKNKLKAIKDWELFLRLHTALEAKFFNKTKGKKRAANPSDKRGEHANKAGTKQFNKCTLITVEGNSAMSYGVTAMEHLPGGRDYWGLYPLRGKPLNAINASPFKIAANKVLNGLKNMLGMEETLDYTIESNFSKLKYGRLLLIVDADVDGKHIMGLVIAYFKARFPSLLVRNYVWFMRTPILRLTYYGKEYNWFTIGQYNQDMIDRPELANKKPEYYKGLASSTDDDVANDFKTPVHVSLLYDDNANDYISLAFNKKYADERKTWMRKFTKVFNVEKMDIQPISAFINFELIEYSIYNLIRSIPHMLDGDKRSQRQALYGSMVIFKPKIGKKYKKLKVNRLVARCAEITDYAHGETSLIDTVNSEAESFPGSNNLPKYAQKGQFGTRNKNKDAGAARYTATTPMWWWRYIYRDEDERILESRLENGDPVEPIKYLPILPMVLVNGSQGVATGWSTFVPNYNPIDLAYWIINRAQGLDLPILIPWYRDFKGRILMKHKNMKKRKNVEIYSTGEGTGESDTAGIVGELNLGDDEEENKDITTWTEINQGIAEREGDEIDPEFDEDMQDNLGPSVIDSNATFSMIVEGVFEVDNKDVITITELPIGYYMHDYKNWLDKQKEKGIIKKYRSLCTKHVIKFEVYGMSNPTLEKLRLKKTVGLSNMIMLDDEGRPHHFHTVDHYMETFYAMRIFYIQQRKDQQLLDIMEKIQDKQYRVKFINAAKRGEQEGEILGETIVFIDRTKQSVIEQTLALGIPEEIPDKISTYDYTVEKINKLQEEINVLNTERERIFQLTPEQMWVTDIMEFLQAYGKHYKCPVDAPRSIDPSIYFISADEDKKKLSDLPPLPPLPPIGNLNLFDNQMVVTTVTTTSNTVVEQNLDMGAGVGTGVSFFE